MTILDQSLQPTVVSRRRRSRSTMRARELSPSLPRLVLHAAARGVALFFGLFALVNLAGAVRHPGLDENIWWLDLRPLSPGVSALLLGLAGALLVWWALRPAAPPWRRLLTAAALVALTVIAVKNGVTFYHVWADGLIRPGVGFPLTFVFAVLFGLLAAAVVAPGRAPRTRWTPLLMVAVVVLCGVLFPVAQQEFFGKTTYLRHAQTAVVFGAQVHRDGTPSPSLAARIRAAVRLYKDGRADRLLMSGARGADEPANETQVMRSLAMAQGVPAAAISVDPAGFNTDATVRDTLPVLKENGSRPVAVVTDYFHLARVKLAYLRAGVDVITVPSRGPQPPSIVILREIPAFWVYYLRAVL